MNIKGIDKHVGLLAVVFGEFTVNSSAVEVATSDVAFESFVICGFSHSCDELHRKITVRKK